MANWLGCSWLYLFWLLLLFTCCVYYGFDCFMITLHVSFICVFVVLVLVIDFVCCIWLLRFCWFVVSLLLVWMFVGLRCFGSCDLIVLIVFVLLLIAWWVVTYLLWLVVMLVVFVVGYWLRCLCVFVFDLFVYDFVAVFVVLAWVLVF